MTASEFLASQKSRKSKYNVAPAQQRTWNGRVYASKGEMRYAQHLWNMVEHGQIREVVEQPCVRLGLDSTYRPDFLIVPTGGTAYYVDFKGVETADFRRNVKLWAKYGRLDLQVVKLKGERFITDRVIRKEGQ